MTVTGKITWIEQGSGTWAIVTNDGKTYELYGSKATALNEEGQTVSITGKLREDVMTMAMIGPVLEVESFEKN